MFYHTFCTSGAFRLDETSYLELKPCKLQWFLHFRTGPPAPSPEIVRKSVQKFSPKQNRTRPECRLVIDPTSRRISRVLFCFVLLARKIDHRKSTKSFPSKQNKTKQNKTKQNAARMPSGNRPDLTKNLPRFVLFCFVLLAREIDHRKSTGNRPEITVTSLIAPRINNVIKNV